MSMVGRIRRRRRMSAHMDALRRERMQQRQFGLAQRKSASGASKQGKGDKQQAPKAKPQGTAPVKPVDETMADLQGAVRAIAELFGVRLDAPLDEDQIAKMVKACGKCISLHGEWRRSVKRAKGGLSPQP